MGRFRRRPETGLEVHVGKGKGKANAMGRDGSEGSKGSGSTRRGWRRGGCRAIALLAWILALAPLGCGGGSEGGGPTDASSGCHSDLECSDGIFCNGSEICLPGAAGADALGCLPAPSPRCLASQQCDEASLRCLTRCELEGDADGDGHDDPACGGDDCDDADPDRYPGNLERCDAEHLDEDCDPSTLGGPSDGDADGDGFVSAACCNWMGSELRCGDDCDDAAASVNPDAAEICNGIDEDCDGALDEGVYQTFFVDTDGDGYGDPALRHWGPCVPDPLLVDTASDCDDTDPAIHPGVPELCDGIDNDCDGIVEIDADEDGFVRAGAACTGGTLGVGDCNDTERSVHPDAIEICDGIDNDCDGTPDQRPLSDAICEAGLPHTSAICHERSCAISACEDGWRDCNRDRLDGCEADLRTSPSSCGGCGIRCPAGEQCLDGVCGVACTVDPLSCPDGIDPAVPGGTLQIALWETDGCVIHGSDPSLGGPISCWGQNYEGCREPTSFDPLSRPTVVEGITDAVQLGLGERHTCALHASGDVSCWGSANEGRTGPSPATWPLGPRPVPLPAGVTQIAVGRNHSCALTGGEIWCWGGNHSLELGSGSCGPSGCTPSDSGTPVRVDLSPFSATAVELAAGYEHTCALLSDARVVCWGDGWFGQRGDLAATGPDAPRSPPALVQQLDTSPGAPAGTYFDLQAVAIAAGAHHTCALLPPNPATGANIVCWGNNEDGQLGRGLPAPGAARAYAETIDGTLQANALVAGAGHTCARVGAGLGLDRLYCWGLGSSGQLGQLDTRSRWGAEGSVFDTASNDGGWLPLDAGAFAARGDSSCAVRAIDSRVLCWGANASGQLGDGSLRQSAFPVPVRTIAPGTQLALGDEHLCGRRADGWISCTGRGDAQDALERSLASGANERTALADIASLGRARAVAAGQSHTCALGLDGRIRCAGSNYLGQLGNGSDLDSSAAVLVGGDLAPISDALAIATAWHHGCALRAGGAVSCWGAGESGQLGDGRIRGSADDCGDGSRSAITMAGFLGQIPCSRAPVDVVGLPAPAVQIGVGLGTSCARLGESADGSLPAGSVYCWGAGGTLGDGTQIASATPIRVLGVEGAIDLGVGSMHACAVIASGRIECWGIEAGWLGDGVLSRPETCFAVGMDGPCALTPVRVVGLDEAVQVAAGMTATCALLEGGSVSCWGRNARGEVGDGTRRTRLVPGAPIAGLPRAEELVGGPSAFCALAPEGGASCWGRGPVIGTGGWLDELSPMPLRGF